VEFAPSDPDECHWCNQAIQETTIHILSDTKPCTEITQLGVENALGYPGKKNGKESKSFISNCFLNQGRATSLTTTPIGRKKGRKKLGNGREGSYLGVGVIEKQGPKHGRKLVIGALGGRDVVELEHAHGRHGANITIAILEARAQRANEILDEIFDAQGAQGAQGEATNHRIVVMAVLLQEIDGEQSEIGMTARVIAHVEVAHFLEDQIGGGGTHDHLGEEGGHIDADGHIRDDLFVELALDVLHARLPAASQLPQLALAIVGIHGGRRGEGGREGKRRRRRGEHKGRQGQGIRAITETTTTTTRVPVAVLTQVTPALRYWHGECPGAAKQAREDDARHDECRLARTTTTTTTTTSKAPSRAAQTHRGTRCWCRVLTPCSSLLSPLPAALPLPSSQNGNSRPCSQDKLSRNLHRFFQLVLTTLTIYCTFTCITFL
jgi:hypothetical protein